LKSYFLNFLVPALKLETNVKNFKAIMPDTEFSGISKKIYSVSCGLSAAPAPDGTGRYRSAPVGTGWHRSAPGTTGTGTGTDRPGLFYDVFNKNFLNIMTFWAI
jgi:hypothetical protein